MANDDFLDSELLRAKQRVAALPAWRRAVFERARAAEIDLGYIRERISCEPVSTEAMPPQPCFDRLEANVPSADFEAQLESE